MKILGINYLSESSISLIENGKIIFSISEERINRIKNWYGNPYKSINQMLSTNNLNLKDIDLISTHGLAIYKNERSNQDDYLNKIKLINNSRLPEKLKFFQVKQIRLRRIKELKATERARGLINSLKKKFKREILVYDHHECHAASAAFFSGWRKSYVLTIDGWGDGYSSKLFKFQNDKLQTLRSTSLLDSLGYFYGSITKTLGFKPHRHEGKILGLAAYGNYKKAYSDISKMISFDKYKKNFISHPEKGLYLPDFSNKNLNYLVKKYKKEDVAAAAQRRLEEIVTDYIKSIDNKAFKLTLAGGIFSNVKLNQKISEINKVKDIYIFPNMGDGGLSVGAAALYYAKTKKKFRSLDNVYLGPAYKNEYIKKQLLKYKLKFIFSKNLTKKVAEKINNNKVVGIFQGKMEFGPRALGNRSIFVNAKNNKINISLNKKLGRTEFMPFAPITLEKQAKKMYLDFKKGKLTSKFMTITYKCSSAMKKISPATVHVDGTARPQIITRKINPKIYKLLNEYYKLSKIPNLINTSFNMHEEPIVCSPNDAIKSFLRSNIDYLYIGDFLVSNHRLID